MSKRRSLKMKENGRYLSLKLSNVLVSVFSMDNTFCFLSLFLSASSQGSDKMRDIPVPEELVFTVDQKIQDEIGCTKELYYKKVEFLAASLKCH